MFTPQQVTEALDRLQSITGRDDLIVPVRTHIDFLRNENMTLHYDAMQGIRTRPKRGKDMLPLSPIVVRENVRKTTEGVMRNRRYIKRARRERWIDLSQMYAVEIGSFIGLLILIGLYWGVALWLTSTGTV
jgi:hypothetical protein